MHISLFRLTFLTLICLSMQMRTAHAQAFTRAKIYAGQSEWGKLNSQGIALDHTIKHPDYIQGSFSVFELQTMAAMGYVIDVINPDAEAYYRTSTTTKQRQVRTNCPDRDAVFSFERPQNFQFGSMKGHPTLSQMMEQLHDMHAKYPDLISAPEPIGDFRTAEGRAIYTIRISDKPKIGDNKPQILYTALHHAREPISMTQMLYFMWYILENYDRDPRIQEIVNETEMHFVPCVNPDGYVYNEQTNPTGGGLWRKNRRRLDSGEIGVDLNRNYGYKWGLDNLGSSSNPVSEIYRGSAPFSEPETQAIEYLVKSNDFRLALNYHAWGNFLIYPLGYTNEPAADIHVFRNIGDLLTRENRYVHGAGFETVSYFTNGDSDDWMYLDDSKPSILSFTPEIGGEDQGFWPAVGDVEFLCKSVLGKNINAAFFLLNSGAFVDESPAFLTEKQGQFPFRLTKFGFEEVGLQVTFQPLTNNISIFQPSKFYILDLFAVQSDNFTFELADNIQDGEEIVIAYTIDNGSYAYTDTLRKSYHTPDFEIKNDGTMEGWKTVGISAAWAPVEHTYYSPPSSLTDSPLGNYFPLSSNDLVYDGELDLTGADSAVFYFQARWDIQPTLDYLTFDVSADGGDFVPQCGLYTRPGGPRQLPGAPVYSGRQLSWVNEQIDLSEYIGQRIQIRFSMNSRSNDSRDGIYVDDLRLLMYNEGEVSSTQFLLPEDFLLETYPNPAHNHLVIRSESFASSNPLDILIHNQLGQLIHRLDWQSTANLDTQDWPNGTYFVHLQWEDGRRTRAKHISIAR